jgi:hypothetical protein
VKNLLCHLSLFSIQVLKFFLDVNKSLPVVFIVTISSQFVNSVRFGEGIISCPVLSVL